MLKKNTLLLVFLLLLSISCKKADVDEDDDDYDTSHVCYITSYADLNSRTESFYYNEDNYLKRHIISRFGDQKSDFKYNSDNQIVKRIYLWNDMQTVNDTTDYYYLNDSLKKTIMKHYLNNTFVSEYVEIYNYLSSGNIIKTTLIKDNHIYGYVEKYYENDMLIKIVNYNSNQIQTKKVEFSYNSDSNFINVTKNGVQYMKVYFDNKNNPLKHLNIFNSKNRRIEFLNYSSLTFYETNFLLSNNNPIVIETPDYTKTITYKYNVYGYPKDGYNLNSNFQTFSYKCNAEL